MSGPDQSAHTGIAGHAHRIPPDGRPAEHMVLTVGGSPIPVLLTLLSRRPRQVSAITSNESTPVWHRVVAALQTFQPAAFEHEPIVIEVDPWDGADVAQAVARAAPSSRPWELGYSGGTPAMSAAAFEAWWRTGRPSGGQTGDAAAWYAAERGDVLVNQDGAFLEAGDVLGGRNLPLADLLTLHGLEPRGLLSRAELWSPHTMGITPAEARAALWALPEKGPASERAAWTDAAEQVVLDALALVAERGGADVYRRCTATVPAVHGAGHPDQPGHVVELGISAVRGLQLRMLDVSSYEIDEAATREAGDRTITRRVRLGTLKESLFDAEHRAREAGGIHAGAALVSLEPVEPNEPPLIESIWGDLGPDASPTRLPDKDGEAEPALPASTAFSLRDLLLALDDVESGTSLVESDDLARWMCGVTE